MCVTLVQVKAVRPRAGWMSCGPQRWQGSRGRAPACWGALMGGTLSRRSLPGCPAQAERCSAVFDLRHVGAVSNYSLGSGGVYFYVLYGIIIDYNCTLLTLTRCAGQTGEIRLALLQAQCVLSKSCQGSTPGSDLALKE